MPAPGRCGHVYIRQSSIRTGLSRCRLHREHGFLQDIAPRGHCRGAAMTSGRDVAPSIAPGFRRVGLVKPTEILRNPVLPMAYICAAGKPKRCARCEAANTDTLKLA